MTLAAAPLSRWMKRRGGRGVSASKHCRSYLSCSHISIRYSDDEDTSYKIRCRSATKLLAAVIGTRPDRLTRTYKDVSSVPISRFGDREESV